MSNGEPPPSGNVAEGIRADLGFMDVAAMNNDFNYQNRNYPPENDSMFPLPIS